MTSALLFQSETPAEEVEELRRIPVVGDDGSWLTAIESRYFSVVATERGWRRRVGARFWQLRDGTAVRLVDERTYLNDATGELLRTLEAGL